MRYLSVAALLLVVAVVVPVSWLLLVYPRATPAAVIDPADDGDVVIELDDATTAGSLADQLARAGIVDESWLFAAYLRIIGAEGRLREGPVALRIGMTPVEILRRIAEGYGPVFVRVIVPEGFSRFDIAARLEHYGICAGDAFVAATENAELLADHDIAAASAEGYLFPDTYELRVGMPPKMVLARMVQNFRRRVLPLLEQHADGMARLRAELGFGLFEALTLASIVEKEAAVADERSVVAGVFLNRLRSPTFRPKRLQADPTVSYGCRQAPQVSAACRDFDGRTITRAMLADRQNPYNTYRHDGLPPGPIANPGLSAIGSVLAPAEHDYLYFVARGDGRHRFSVSLHEHNRAVAERRDGSDRGP